MGKVGSLLGSTSDFTRQWKFKEHLGVDIKLKSAECTLFLAYPNQLLFGPPPPPTINNDGFLSVIFEFNSLPTVLGADFTLLAGFTTEAGGPMSLPGVVVGAVDCCEVEPPHVTGRETLITGLSSFVLAASVAIFCKSEFFETELVTGAAATVVEVVVFVEGTVLATVVDEGVVVGVVVVGVVVVGVVDAGLDAMFTETVEESRVSTLLTDCSSAGLLELSGTPLDVDDATALLTEDVIGFEVKVLDAAVDVVEETELEVLDAAVVVVEETLGSAVSP